MLLLGFYFVAIFFGADLIKPFKKKQKLVPFFYNLVAFCTCTSILVY